MRCCFIMALVSACLVLAPSRAGTFVQIRLPLGDIGLELYDQDKPETVQNFLRYIKEGKYTNNMVVHRWEPRFVIQGGGFFVTNRFGAAPRIEPIPTFGTIKFEAGVGQKFSNLYGTIAMARVGTDTNSASSQWFLNLTNNTALDTNAGGYTVFGHVVSGTNVLNRFNLVSTNNGIYRIDLRGALNHFPVLDASYDQEDFVYADITTLGVSVSPLLSGGREIAWNSATNVVNIVEFTSEFPPQWTTLLSTNGTGQRLSVADENLDAPYRFYRVRIAQ